MNHYFKSATAASSSHHSDDHHDIEPINIGLVLTGGGSHGAYSAGVLESILPYLCKTGAIQFVRGTSAGGVNAVAVGSGLNSEGPQEAIRRLRRTWDEIKSCGLLMDRGLRFFSDAFLPKEKKWPNIPTLPFNPVAIFQSVLPSFVAQYISHTILKIVPDWKQTVQKGHVKIAINTVLEVKGSPYATEHVILQGEDLTPDGVGASANIKQFGYHYIADTQNPKLKGRKAYDGAYEENGPMQPLPEDNITDYVLIILHDRRHNTLDAHNDLKHADIHTQILDLMAAQGHHHKPIRIHAIEIESLGGEIGGLPHMDDSSKMNTSEEFIDMLYAAGIKAGEKWLKENGDHIGYMSSYSFYEPAFKAQEHTLSFS